MIHWDIDPVAFALGPVQIHWYGICWAVAFLGAEFSVRRRLASQSWKDVDVSSLVIVALLGTIVGARLAHCVFYDPSFYLQHPLKVFEVWEGGMASHGGAVGLIAALAWALPRHAAGLPLLSLLDATTFSAAFGGALIRFANFMNSEILGNPTSGSWGVVFERVDAIPRHPVQLYEMAAYLLVLVLLRIAARRHAALERQGLLTGLFLMLVFGARAVIEHWKTPQASYEAADFLSVGQWLSVPFVLLGIALVIRAYRNPRARAGRPVALAP
ncbi:prolipoprotein diacylglyceryl transferase [Roseateles aquatilis]|uniref:Phosphatidylglycerol--prolipoprotein diacylglyceryl transferase n=1 Tax=Roseateles aquatilis TaxID=431061 RepID=A0A246JEI2_9BURK|nr:prolipoprotein diacylglyceryl transferase [Roseateles aquatilis]